MHIEATTRDGRKAVVLTTTAPGFWPVVGYVLSIVDTEDGDLPVAHPSCWTTEGRECFSITSDRDLTNFTMPAIAAE
jgi:hypothetical protein